MEKGIGGDSSRPAMNHAGGLSTRLSSLGG
jgi:hypothetical protein